MKNTKYWTRYQKHRGSVSEQVAVRHLVSVLKPDRTFESLKYLKPRRDVATRALGRDCAEPNAFGDEAEADALVVVDDVAFCLEVKAAAISPGARSGRVQRLATDLAKTVGEARDQAARLTDLIEVNNGLWNSKGQWLDLSGVREVRSLAVTLDDLSSLNCSLDALVRSNIIAAGKLPWVVSLHDLIVALRVLTRPAELLLYLRRRTDSEVAIRYDGADELDFVMLFVQGQLWVNPDPDEMRRRFRGRLICLLAPNGAHTSRRLKLRVSAPIPMNLSVGAWRCAGSCSLPHGLASLPLPLRLRLLRFPLQPELQLLLPDTMPMVGDALQIGRHHEHSRTRPSPSLPTATRRTADSLGACNFFLCERVSVHFSDGQ